jgi:hypothetical protein
MGFGGLGLLVGIHHVQVEFLGVEHEISFWEEVGRQRGESDVNSPRAELLDATELHAIGLRLDDVGLLVDVGRVDVELLVFDHWYLPSGSARRRIRGGGCHYSPGLQLGPSPPVSQPPLPEQ